jgi:hypothetical protein
MSTPWHEAFLFTQAIEIPVYLVGMQRERLELGWARRALVAFGATALTHPIVWFVLPLTISLFAKLGSALGAGSPQLFGYWGYVAVAETFAVGAEAIYLGMFGVKRPLVLAFVANGASAGIGLTLRHFFGWP